MFAGLLIIASATAPAEATQVLAENQAAILVTGERAKRSLKDTSSSVSLFNRRDLDRMAAPDRIQNVLAMVPNVLMPTSRDAPIIRGQIRGRSGHPFALARC